MAFVLFVFLISFLMILFYSVHYIFLLLLLEILLLSIFMGLGFFYFSHYGILGIFLFILFVVCMGGFSISLLVFLARLSGRDFWYFRFVF